MSSTSKKKKKESLTAKEWRISLLSTPQAAKAKPHLLALPAELRNQIYELAVIASRPITAVWLDHHMRRDSEVKMVQQPGLALACRQLQNEVLPIFYGANTFSTTFYAGAWYNGGSIKYPGGIGNYRSAQLNALLWWLGQAVPKGVTQLLVHTNVKASEICKLDFLVHDTLSRRLTHVAGGWQLRRIKCASAWERSTDGYMDCEPDHYWLIKDKGASSLTS